LRTGFRGEGLFCASLDHEHLSRLCEEILPWAIRPSASWPARRLRHGIEHHAQKEKIRRGRALRGKTGRVYGSLVSLLTVLKALPLAYNRDMQEDKEPFFDADDTVRASLRIMAEMLRALAFRTGRMREALGAGFLNATELADYLAAGGLPFREAHRVAGRAVALAEARGVGIEALTLAQLRELSALVDEDVFETLAYESAWPDAGCAGYRPGSVADQIAELRRWLTRP
jgi:argininosuccinate lyase